MTAKLCDLATEINASFPCPGGLAGRGFRREWDPLLTFRRSVLPHGHQGRRAFPGAAVPTFYKMGIS